MATSAAALVRPAKPEANAHVQVYGYQWGFGPFRWAFSTDALLRDRVDAIRKSRDENWPLDAIGPTRTLSLAKLPEEHYYVGGI